MDLWLIIGLGYLINAGLIVYSAYDIGEIPSFTELIIVPWAIPLLFGIFIIYEIFER